METGRELERIRASRSIATSLMDRFGHRLDGWDHALLNQFVRDRSIYAERLGITSRADVCAFVETVLLLAPSLENAKEFQAAISEAPNADLRMLHAIKVLPPGYLARLTVADAPGIWLNHLAHRGQGLGQGRSQA